MWNSGTHAISCLERPVGQVPIGATLLVLAAGCGIDNAPPPSAEVRDSAGITLVENRGEIPSRGGGWSLSSEPTVAIGSLDGPEGEQLYRVRGALRLPDGRIVAANDGTKDLRVFASDGSHVASIGREGEGPGEFSSIRLLGLLGDALVLLDRRLRRVSLIHPDEGFVRSFPLPDGVAPYPMDGWLFDTGSVLIQDLPLTEEGAHEEGFNRTPVAYASCDLSGAVLTDFGRLPGAERVNITRETEHGLATLLSSVPFGRDPRVAVSGDLLFFGAQDAYEVTVYRSDGSVSRMVRLDREPVPVTDADLAAFIEEDLRDYQDENEARERRQELEAMPRMAVRPPHGAIFADRSGSLFVAEYRMPGDTTVGMNVFDPTGRLTGRFSMPADLEVLDLGDDYLLGLLEDDLGVETLRLYGLSRTSSGSR